MPSNVAALTIRLRSVVGPRRAGAKGSGVTLADGTLHPANKGLIGFDVETGSRSCDRSCSDSLNGATNRSAKSDFTLAA